MSESVGGGGVTRASPALCAPCASPALCPPALCPPCASPALCAWATIALSTAMSATLCSATTVSRGCCSPLIKAASAHTGHQTC